MNVTNECKTYGIKNIFVSGLKIRNRLYSDFINALSNALKLEWVKYGYDFIKNSNILPDNLWQDGVHLNSSGNSKLLNDFLVSLNENYFFRTFYPRKINRVSSERGKSVLSDEDDVINQSKIIPNSFDSTERNDILEAKIGLREMKTQCSDKIIVADFIINSMRNTF